MYVPSFKNVPISADVSNSYNHYELSTDGIDKLYDCNTQANFPQHFSSILVVVF